MNLMYERVEREKFFDELLAGLRNSQDKKDWIEAQNLKANELKLLFLNKRLLRCGSIFSFPSRS